MSKSLPRHICGALLLVLRPAESAVRRLVIIAARGLVLVPRNASAPVAALRFLPGANLAHTPVFCLFDPLKGFGTAPEEMDCGPLPRISVPGIFDPVFAAPLHMSPDDPVSAQSICRRLNALSRALDNLQGQARRLARWRARRTLAQKADAPFRPGRLSPFRPGLPPGHRKRQIHDVDEILLDCHHFALEAWKTQDTS
ncbi:MAG: hypothetical protein WCC66_00140 [Rhizobiaceae bacterium]